MIAMGLFVCLMPVLCSADDLQNFADRAFSLGPVPATLDLRNMVRTHIVRRSCELLDKLAAKRKAAFESGQWQPWRDEVRNRVRVDLGELKYGANGPDLNIRFVSRHEQKGFVVENVLFESLPGWDVNASVYLPDTAAFPPPWPAIVVPVGHSGKQMSSYQIPCQVFARLGYVAVSFDPPGMAGEKQGGNDHFSDGVRCYLTGESSNRYFIIDALRCIDYLVARKDIDMSRGVGMTGVSGGGYTTMFATLLDDRIAASGPACTAVPNALHPVLDVYAPCVETLAANRFNGGYDDMDILAAAAPVPLLLMAGAKDEVFKDEWSGQIAEATKQAYAKAGHADRFAYFSDPGGHDYTVAMALEFVKWMERWTGDKERPLPALNPDDFPLVPAELLKCHPRLDANIFSENRDCAVYLRDHRSGMPVAEAVAKLVFAGRKDGIASSGTPRNDTKGPKCRVGERTLVWTHWLEELMIEPEPGIELPATLLYPAREGWRGGAVLYFDDRGRWSDLRGQGLLASMTHFTDKDTNGPAVLTVDVRGWGDTKPADTPYDIAGWADRQRWIAYVSAAMGDPISAMRVRDGLAALAYLRSRGGIDPAKIVVGGRGAGGMVALHVAVLDGAVSGVFTIEGLATFESLATSERYAWSHEDFMPGVLAHYDLPQLTQSLKMPVLLLNPLNAAKEPLDAAAATELYPPKPALCAKVGLDGTGLSRVVTTFVSSPSDK